MIPPLHIFHTWQKWCEPIEGTTNYLWGTKVKGLFQTRICETCGKVEVRRIDK